MNTEAHKFSFFFHFIMKISLNSEGHQFHHCQQNEQSTLILPPPPLPKKKEKRPRQMTFEIEGLAWERHKHVAGLNRLMEWQTTPSW